MTRDVQRPSLRILLLFGGAVVLAGCAAQSAGTPEPAATAGSDQACAAPVIAGPASNTPLRPGERVELTIENLAPFCADTPRMTDNANDEPVDAFDVVWVQGDRRTVIDVVQPNDGSPLTVEITVPADAAPGAASILIGTAALPVEVAAAP